MINSQNSQTTENIKEVILANFSFDKIIGILISPNGGFEISLYLNEKVFHPNKKLLKKSSNYKLFDELTQEIVFSKGVNKNMISKKASSLEIKVEVV